MAITTENSNKKIHMIYNMQKDSVENWPEFPGQSSVL